MDIVEKLILWILILGGSAYGGRVVLNGPQIQTSDLRDIDGYVSSGLPLFPSTHGFVLHSGMRPVIVKVKDPNKVIRDGIEQPNTGYYRDLPSVIPAGFEGIASTSFLLGNPIPPSNLFSTAGPGNAVQHLMQQQQEQQPTPPRQFQQFQPSEQSVVDQLRSRFQHQHNLQQQMNFQQFQQQPQQQQPQLFQQQQQQQPQNLEQQQNQNQQPFAQQSVRVESTLRQNNEVPDQAENSDKLTRNAVVVQTSEFESGLPDNLRNPFYSNQSTAAGLAQESLPAPGEQVVQQWNTHKIKEGRVRDLLTGAGLI